MSNVSDDSISWAPRLKPALIRRLYESDAAGRSDESLVDEVGIGLFARCEAIQRATKRLCPVCGGRLDGAWDRGRDRRLDCSACGWRSTWEAFHTSYRAATLHGGRATENFIRFCETYRGCRTYAQKMLAIDRLVHSLHEWARGTLTFPAAYNLIEGSREDVFRLLEDLAYGDQQDASRAGLRSEYFDHVGRSPEVTRQEGRSFEALHTVMVERIAGAVSAVGGNSEEVGVAYIDRCTYVEFVEVLSDPVLTYVFTINPCEGLAVLAYDQRAVATLTAGKRSSMDKVVAGHLSDVQATWAPVCALSFSAARMEDDRDRMEVGEPDDPVYLVAIDLGLTPASGQIIVCYLSTTIESLLPDMPEV